MAWLSDMSSFQLATYFLFTILAFSSFLDARQGIKNCNDSGFCKRNRALAKNITDYNLPSHYEILRDSIDFSNSLLSAQIKNTKENVVLTLEFSFLSNDAVRIKVNEKSSIKKRYDQSKEYALVGEPKLQSSNKLNGSKKDNTYTVKYSKDHNSKVIINFKPIKFDFYYNNKPVISFNERSLFNFEHYRERKSTDNNDLSYWEETFNGYLDPKKDGPSSIGVDVTFHKFEHVYGIPQHASNTSLKTTNGEPGGYNDPYRLYNLDIFAYEVDSPSSTYGSVPFMVAHRKGQSAGIFWLNSAEMWVDVEKKKQNDQTTTHTHWVAESGILDLFVFLSNEPKSILKQYGDLTGFTALPPSFALGYHQCRWNYMNTTDVEQVDAGFDKYDIPYDVLWLDIEHTDSKKYFTWDPKNFTDPIGMQNKLANKGRKMVTIVDPHIKNDKQYYIFNEATDNGYFVKNANNTDFSGDCWPGKSSWVDYTNNKASEWWSSKFSLKSYNGSTENLFIWNDMNEPAVFNSIEGTMPKSNLHFNNIEHRDVHNLFGMLFHRSSAFGLVKRLTPNRRPFVLSRAYFPGTQRIGAIWTGDNVANWDYLSVSSPMLLSVGLSGVSFSGADVGGFFGDPEPELLVRWYQVGAFQPFFRGHAHMDSKRREPWLFGEPYTSQIRKAIRNRYQLLPYWYTLFFESGLNGTPAMRPLFLEFPEDEKVFGIDEQYMVGSSLLVKPITRPNVTETKVYLPGKQVWYNYFNYESMNHGNQIVKAPADTIPVFIKSGQIITQKNQIKRSSSLMKQDPITLIITVDSEGYARGKLYLDDGETYDYLKSGHSYREFVFKNSRLTNKPVNSNSYKVINPLPFQPSMPTNSLNSFKSIKIEKIIILGLTKSPNKVHCLDTNRELKVEYDTKLNKLVILNPNLVAVENWNLNFD